MNTAPDALRWRLAEAPRPDPAWFRRSSGEDATGTIHGVDHVRRVCLLALELADALGVQDEEREALRLASLWHDIGREHDGGDYFHGARSAGKVIGLGLHLGVPPGVVALALFACTFHVPEDTWAERAAQHEPNPEASLRVLRILKDADALDRVRLGPHNLKPHLLRLPESRARIELARALLRASEVEASP